jgi:hypothetical protein
VATKRGKTEARGEVILDDRGQMLLPLEPEKSYVVRPSREAVAAIERKIKPLYQLTEDALRGCLTLEEMAVMTTEMMRAHAKAYPEDPDVTTYANASVDRVADLIYEASPPKICARLAVVLVGAMNGGYSASGELKPAGATTKTRPAASAG